VSDVQVSGIGPSRRKAGDEKMRKEFTKETRPIYASPFSFARFRLGWPQSPSHPIHPLQPPISNYQHTKVESKSEPESSSHLNCPPMVQHRSEAHLDRPAVRFHTR
jgi:hypothetical protein